MTVFSLPLAGLLCLRICKANLPQSCDNSWTPPPMQWMASTLLFFQPGGLFCGTRWKMSQKAPLHLPLLSSPSLFWCLINYTTVHARLICCSSGACLSSNRNARKLQMITWLESTNRIQVIMWHLSFYWWIQVMWSLAVLHSDFCWASNPKTHYHGTQCLTYYVICQRTELTWKSEDDQSELRWCHLWWSV